MPTDKEQRARDLHERSVVIIGHDHQTDYQHLLRMRDGGVDAKVCMLQTDVLVWDEEGADSVLGSLYGYEGWARRALAQMERVLGLTEAHPDRFLLVRCVDDILEAESSGRSGLIFGFEGARPLEGEIALLGAYHRLGLRHLQLTWAFGNQLCDLMTPPEGQITWDNLHGTKTPGLTEFGREVVKEADRLGIVLDPGHATDRTFYELLEATVNPIVISHASCRDAGKNAGDIGDEKLRALAENGGVIGVHFFAHYLAERNATLDDLIDHILHVGEVVGIEHVGLGADYLDLSPRYRAIHDLFAGIPAGTPRPADRPLGPISELDDISKMPRLTQRMVERGLTDEEIGKVLGGNLLRVYCQVWR